MITRIAPDLLRVDFSEDTTLAQALAVMDNLAIQYRGCIAWYLDGDDNQFYGRIKGASA